MTVSGAFSVSSSATISPMFVSITTWGWSDGTLSPAAAGVLPVDAGCAAAATRHAATVRRNTSSNRCRNIEEPPKARRPGSINAGPSDDRSQDTAGGAGQPRRFASTPSHAESTLLDGQQFHVEFQRCPRGNSGTACRIGQVAGNNQFPL